MKQCLWNKGQFAMNKLFSLKVFLVALKHRHAYNKVPATVNNNGKKFENMNIWRKNVNLKNGRHVQSI